jgi:hypothetical protein
VKNGGLPCGELVSDVKQDRRGLPDSKFLSFASPKERNQRKGDLGLPLLRNGAQRLQQSRFGGNFEA